MNFFPYRAKSTANRRVSNALRRLRAIWQSSPASYRIRASLVQVRHKANSGPKLLQLLLVSDGTAYSSEQQFAPILRHATLLRRQLGVVVQHRSVDAAVMIKPRDLSSFQLVGLKFSFRTPQSRAESLVRHFRTALMEGPTRLVYFDGDDDLNIQWPAILKMVDLYVKKHVFSDKQGYLSPYIGKSNLTDYVARNYGVSFATDIIPASPGIDPFDLGKIHLGWNIALDDKILSIWQQFKSVSAHAKDIDISCRAAVSQSMWIHPFRDEVLRRIESMSDRFRVLAPRDRVPQEKYYEELLRSRVCVSPFGYGEICWRDFEAIILGCLLVKPDMSHVRTLPDLFIPDVTYVSVKWDYSDLEDKCILYLLDEEKRRKIAEHARSLLVASFGANWFLTRFCKLLTCAGIESAVLSSRPTL